MYKEYIFYFEDVQKWNNNISIEEFDNLREKSLSGEVCLIVYEIIDENGEQDIVIRIKEPWMPTDEEYQGMIVEAKNAIK